MDYLVSKTPVSAEADHIVPFSRGGTDSIDNGRTICRQCNQSRGASVETRVSPPVSGLVAW